MSSMHATPEDFDRTKPLRLRYDPLQWIHQFRNEP
jgi:hypothetical protein